MKIEPVFLDKREASARNSISVRALDYARADGNLPFYRHGRKVLFRVDDLDKYMDRFRVDVAEVKGK